MRSYDSLTQAVLRRPVELGQYACEEYSALLETHGIQPSMSRVGRRTTMPRPRAS